MVWSLYRQSPLGETIEYVLNILGQGHEELGEKDVQTELLDVFDREVEEYFKCTRAVVSIKCDRLVAYRETFGVWTFWLKDCVLRERSNNLVKLDSLQIVAVGDATQN